MYSKFGIFLLKLKDLKSGDKMNVPKLRFKEFNDEYKSIKLNDVSEIYDGTHETPTYVEKGVKFVSVENISNLLDTTKFIPESDYNKYKIKPKYNDVFMTRIGDIGTSSIYKSDEKLAYYVSLALLRTKDNHILIPDYLNQYIKNNSFQKELYNRTIHVAFPKKINTGEIGECSINLCSDKEQLKVSNFLSLLDKKIELQSKKIEDLKLFKKGLSNNIFNNLKNFEEYKLGDLCNITTGKLDANAMVENGKYRFYTCAKEYSFIDEYSFDTEALLISGNGAYVGYIHYYNGKFNAYQRTYVLDQFSQNIQFIKCYLDENLSRRIKSEKKEGNTPYIVLSTLSDMIIKVPSKENQKNISNIINYHQKKILLEENKLKKLQELKKGLMQNMFV